MKKRLILAMVLVLLVGCLGSSLAASDTDRKLTIWLGTTFPDPEYIEEFKRHYPEVTLEIVTPPEEDILDSFTTMMNSDKQADVILLSSYQADLSLLSKQGYAAALESDNLKANVTMMHPQIKRYVYQGDSLLAFPASLEPFYWTANARLFDLAGDKLPETYDDFLNMALIWYHNNLERPINHCFDGSQSVSEQQNKALYLIIHQAMNEADSLDALTFDTPAFNAAIEKTALLSQRQDQMLQLAHSYDNVYLPKLFDTKAISPLYQHLNPEYQDECHILPPVLSKGKTPVIPAALEYFIVNPGTKNRENALKFIEFYWFKADDVVSYTTQNILSRQLENTELAAEFAEDTAILQNTIYQTETRLKAASNMLEASFYQNKLRHHRNELADLEQVKYAWPIENIAKCSQLAPYFELERSAQAHRFATDPEVKNMINHFLEGSASPDQLVGELDILLSEFLKKDK